MRLALQKNGDVVAVHFEADTLFQRDGVGLMWGLVEHGSEAKKLALRRLVDDDFLLVLVDGGDPHRAGDQNVGSPSGVADFPDALPRSESLDLDLSGQHRGFFVIQQGKQGNTSQDLWAARHRSPRR